MSEPDNRLIEAVVAFSEFEDKIIATGLRFDLQAAFWGQGSEVKNLSASSDPIAKQLVLQAAILADGSARLMEAKKSVYPPNADLNPQNARIVHSTGSVYYSEDGPFETNLFSQFEEIFKVGNK